MASKVVKFFFFGCLLFVIGCVLVIGGGGYYIRSQILKYAGNTGEYKQKADQLNQQYPFQPPTNGIITEQQIHRFIAVRKQVHAVYSKYESEFKNLQSKNTDLSVFTRGWSAIKEV